MPLPTDMYDLIGIMDRQYFYTKVLNLISELKEKGNLFNARFETG